MITTMITAMITAMITIVLRYGCILYILQLFFCKVAAGLAIDGQLVEHEDLQRDGRAHEGDDAEGIFAGRLGRNGGLA